MTDRTLPKRWQVLKFGELAESITERVEDPGSSGLEYYVGLEHLDPDTPKISRWGSPTEVEATKLRFSPGDVIYARRRAYQRKLGVAEWEGVASAHSLVLRARPTVCLPRFLPYFLQSDQFHKRALDISVGSLSPTINWRTLAVQEFAVPPVDHQAEFVELLDCATNVVEHYELVLEALHTQAEALAHATAIEAARAGQLTAIADLVETDRPVTYGILKPGTGHPGGVPVIKVKDFPAGRVETANLLLTSPAIDEEYRRSRLRPGDLLISIRGTIGRVAEVPRELDGANITQDTARLSIRPEHDHRYVRYMLSTRDVQRDIASRVTGLAVKGINIGALRQVLVPIPPIERQKELALEFETIERALEAAQSALDHIRRVRSGLRDTLLAGGAA
jgi:type I restriction enzyme, S subunit